MSTSQQTAQSAHLMPTWPNGSAGSHCCHSSESSAAHWGLIASPVWRLAHCFRRDFFRHEPEVSSVDVHWPLAAAVENSRHVHRSYDGGEAAHGNEEQETRAAIDTTVKMARLEPRAVRLLTHFWCLRQWRRQMSRRGFRSANHFRPTAPLEHRPSRRPPATTRRWLSVASASRQCSRRGTSTRTSTRGGEWAEARSSCYRTRLRGTDRTSDLVGAGAAPEVAPAGSQYRIEFTARKGDRKRVGAARESGSPFYLLLWQTSPLILLHRLTRSPAVDRWRRARRGVRTRLTRAIAHSSKSHLRKTSPPAARVLAQRILTREGPREKRPNTYCGRLWPIELFNWKSVAVVLVAKMSLLNFLSIKIVRCLLLMQRI